jgi:hypothetical protein
LPRAKVCSFGTKILSMTPRAGATTSSVVFTSTTFATTCPASTRSPSRTSH